MLENGDSLGRYTLETRLGHGGMAEVWLAQDNQLKRSVAIKFLYRDLAADPDLVRRFIQEAQIMAGLPHKHIIPIYDYQEGVTPSGANTSYSFIVMEYIKGRTLAHYIQTHSRRKKYPLPAEILSLFRPIGEAIDYAHQNRVIHRDIKPSNILLRQPQSNIDTIGEPFLSDFGIARDEDISLHTLAGTFLGSPKYVSPEQADGRDLTAQSDLYSLGIVLYEIMTGDTPFDQGSNMDIRQQHINTLPAPPSLRRPDISPQLDAVILRCIEKKPEDRFASANEMVVALEKALNDWEQTLPPTKNIPTAQKPSEDDSLHLVLPLNAKENSNTSFPPTLPSTKNPVTGPLSSPLPPATKPGQVILPPVHPPMRGRNARWQRVLLFIIIGLIIILLSASLAAFLFTVFTPPTQVNLVTFEQGYYAVNAKHDVLHATLYSLPQPAPGDRYYLWITCKPNTQLPMGFQCPHSWQLPSTTANGDIDFKTPEWPGINYPGIGACILITQEMSDSNPTMLTVYPIIMALFIMVMPGLTSRLVLQERHSPMGASLVSTEAGYSANAQFLSYCIDKHNYIFNNKEQVFSIKSYTFWCEDIRQEQSCRV